jgi:hypothetical protein
MEGSPPTVILCCYGAAGDPLAQKRAASSQHSFSGTPNSCLRIIHTSLIYI